MSKGDKFMAFAGRLGSQKHLVAIRDAFALLMPVIMGGSFATVVLRFYAILGMEENFLPPAIISIADSMWWGSLAMFGILVVPLVAYNLAKSYEFPNPIVASAVAMSCFLLLTSQAHTVTVEEVSGGIWGYVHWSQLNSNALFIGMVISLLATEVFCKLSRNKKLEITMPEGVPPAVARGFSSLFPGILSMVIISTGGYIFTFVFNIILKSGDSPLNIFQIIDAIIATPLRGLADNVVAAVIIAFLNHFLWFFGLHGSNILDGILQTIYTPLMNANTEAFMAGAELTNIVNKQMFDTYVYMGGSGTTLGLIIAILFFSKNKARRTVAKLGTAPGLFNINEPIIFGLPIVLDPILGIPFILTPVVLTIITYVALRLNIAGRIVNMAPWFTPPILSAIATTNKPFTSSVLQVINLIISIVIYLPFVKSADRRDERLEAEAAKN